MGHGVSLGLEFGNCTCTCVTCDRDTTVLPIPMIFPSPNLQHSTFQMPSNSSPTAIPLYWKVLLDQIEKSQEILTFDPSDFELKPFFWYVLFWLSCRFKTKAWGQACGWQQTCDTGYVARISHVKQIPRAKLFVSSFMDDQWRTSFYRSWNPAQGVRGSHRGICCRMSEWMLPIFWSVMCSQIRNC